MIIDNEDYKFSLFTFNIYFKKNECFKEYEEDFISAGLLFLIKQKNKFDISKGKYSTFAVLNCYNGMCKFIGKLKKTNTFDCLSLDYNLYDKEDGEKLSFVDFISYDEDYESQFNCQYILNSCYSIIESQKSKTFKKVCLLYLKFFNLVKIGQLLNISRQCVFIYVKKFRNLLYIKLKEDNYL